MRAVSGIVILILIVLCICIYQSKHTIKDDINSEVYISGRIIKASQSGNHCFGIYLVHVDSATINKFTILSFKDQLPAFQIRKDTAEMYGVISCDDPTGLDITMDGPSGTFITRDKNGKIINQTAIQSVAADNISYVRKYTIFKDASGQDK